MLGIRERLKCDVEKGFDSSAEIQRIYFVVRSNSKHNDCRSSLSFLKDGADQRVIINRKASKLPRVIRLSDSEKRLRKRPCC